MAEQERFVSLVQSDHRNRFLIVIVPEFGTEWKLNSEHIVLRRLVTTTLSLRHNKNMTEL